MLWTTHGAKITYYKPKILKISYTSISKNTQQITTQKVWFRDVSSSISLDQKFISDIFTNRRWAINTTCEKRRNASGKERKERERRWENTLKLPRGFHGQSVRIPGVEAMNETKGEAQSVRFWKSGMNLLQSSSRFIMADRCS